MSLLPLDGPSAQLKVTVTDVTVIEAKAGTAVLDERKVITIQCSEKIYIYFGDGVSTPSVATIQNNGMWQYKNVKETYEASQSQPVYILAQGSSADVVIIERA